MLTSSRQTVHLNLLGGCCVSCFMTELVTYCSSTSLLLAECFLLLRRSPLALVAQGKLAIHFLRSVISSFSHKRSKSTIIANSKLIAVVCMKKMTMKMECATCSLSSIFGVRIGTLYHVVEPIQSYRVLPCPQDHQAKMPSYKVEGKCCIPTLLVLDS